MGTTIAEYFTDELVEWNRLITLYNREMYDFENKLAEVIQRNNIPDIAEHVEEQQNKLNVFSEKFRGLQKQIQNQLKILKTDSTLKDDSLINAGAEIQQNELRRKMQQAEKEYIDTKYDCYNFLSGTLKKKKD